MQQPYMDFMEEGISGGTRLPCGWSMKGAVKIDCFAVNYLASVDYLIIAKLLFHAAVQSLVGK